MVELSTILKQAKYYPDMTEEQQAEVTALREAVSKQLAVSDQINNGDLLPILYRKWFRTT